MIGRRLLHYEITEKLGEGGMGVVYKARDTHLDRFVAIKVLPAERVADPTRNARFVQEAKAASALNHPNILHIYDIGQSGSTDFIAMEYVDGKTLGQLIGRKGLKLGDALKYGAQIAAGLAKAHAAGIVHRDLKPANVMVSSDGVVKLLDFGLAKLTEPAEPDPEAPTWTMKPHTEEGTIVGTVAYMSPEQAEGKPVDARSDIFSFGSVLYEMVTGRRAFQGESKLATLSAILRHEPPPVSTLVAEMPPELEKLIQRCLRKDPARRFQHMDDVRIAETDKALRSDSSSASRPPVHWQRLLTAAVTPDRQRSQIGIFRHCLPTGSSPSARDGRLRRGSAPFQRNLGNSSQNPNWDSAIDPCPPRFRHSHACRALRPTSVRSPSTGSAVPAAPARPRAASPASPRRLPAVPAAAPRSVPPPRPAAGPSLPTRTAQRSCNTARPALPPAAPSSASTRAPACPASTSSPASPTAIAQTTPRSAPAGSANAPTLAARSSAGSG